MLKTKLIHPELLAILAGAGHGSKILIADANYPASTKSGPQAEIVYLNLAPGIVSAVQVLESLLSVIAVEAAHVMEPDKQPPNFQGDKPPVWQEFGNSLSKAGFAGRLTPLQRHDFYEAVQGMDTALVIATAEQRVWSNLLLTMGVVRNPVEELGQGYRIV